MSEYANDRHGVESDSAKSSRPFCKVQLQGLWVGAIRFLLLLFAFDSEVGARRRRICSQHTISSVQPWS